MNRKLLFLISPIIILFLTQNSFAAGMIMRIQQIKSQKQNPRGMTQEQYEQYQQAQQQAAESQTPQTPAPPTYQQTVDQRNQAIAQAIQDEHNPAISSENVTPASSPTVNQNQQQPASLPMNSTAVKDEADLTEVWKKLDVKSTVWTLLIDDQAKVLTVSEYIDRFQKQGVKISHPPMHYVQMIDQIIQTNPQMLNRPFSELIQIVAIVDYDFDNGMDKDDLARKVLGEEGYEANKKRFTQ